MADTQLSCTYQSPIGPLKLVASPSGICAVRWLFGKQCQTEKGSSKARTPTVSEAAEGRPGKRMRSAGRSLDTVASCKEIEPTSLTDGTVEDSPEEMPAAEHLRVCVNWLDAYFNGTLLHADAIPKPALALPDGGEFFHRVWTTLASTGVGERLSYAELAKLAGSPRAARAVGQAVKKHSLPILVPCHRVVKSRGQGKREEVGNYSGGDGTATKEWLLKHESDMIQATKKKTTKGNS